MPCDIIATLTRATYLYCVVKSARKPAAGRVPPGLPGTERPRLVDAGRGLWLVVADVPTDLYGGAALETGLRDLQWVADIAVAHEAVVEHFARMPSVTVVPMKLFTMFSTLDRALEEMRARRSQIAATLRKIAGCQEWGVRVMRGGSAFARAPAGRAGQTGAAFLAARKQARDASREAALAAVRAADAAFAALSSVAKDARRRDDAPEGTAPPLLDAAFLVPAGRRAKFRAEAQRRSRTCGEAGALMTLTGPWPAYNFISAGAKRS